MCISTDYSANLELIWFCFGRLMHLHVLHILLHFRSISIIVFELLDFMCFYPRLSLAACHEDWERWQSPGLGVPLCEGKCMLFIIIVARGNSLIVHIHL